jgi:opacity protein-like surface antigen
MKKIAVALLLSAFVAAPAYAADGKNSVGVNYGLDYSGVFGVQGEFDISSMTNKAPVSVQVFWKKGSQSVFVQSYDISALGVAAIYDLSSVIKLDKKVHPYAGLGVRRETYTVAFGGGTVSASKSELHITFGAQYELNPQVSADINYNDFGGLTIGANFSF